MIATLSMSPTMEFRDTNTAGAPLPLMPRRSSSSTARTTHAAHIFPSATQTPPLKLVVQHATPPDDTSEPSSSSSSSSDGRPTVSIRAKRVRGVRPPEQSTPTPSVFHARLQAPPPSPSVDAEQDEATPRPALRTLIYTPGTPLRAVSTSHLPTPPVLRSSSSTPDATPRLIRKKSGQPVKSSLKSSTPQPRGSLSVLIGSSSSKSAPSTPTLGTKSRVHFDTQLEHVKLFLAEQKPLAVSRDGSPTEDTSGTDGDFPTWIFGGKARLEMRVDVPPAPSEMDVKLQSLALTEDGTGVVGNVAVRNLAFDKWVAVRFTFDAWQTTSEVTARYSHSMPGGAVDMFSFIIRLSDLLARIEGKTMLLAVRYTSLGREMWDNNGGSNYCATFRRNEVKREEEPKPDVKEGDVAADLRTRLERVVSGQEVQGPVQLRGSANLSDKPHAALFKAGGSLASRYDFGTSSRNPWRPSDTPPVRHQRAQSHPVLDDTPSPPSTIPWPSVAKAPKQRPTLGSPRDNDDYESSFRPAPYITSDSEDAPFSVPIPAPVAQRNHQRGYFDVMPKRGSEVLLRTPPGTPIGSTRTYSYPPLEVRGNGMGLGLTLELDGWLTPRGVAREASSGSLSEESTPSFISSAGSSRSASLSPVSPPDYEAGASPTTYHNFLDKFCFYTGPETAIPGLPRTQSVSSVEELLSAASASPQLQAFVLKQHAPTPLRYDDPHTRSGSTTPTLAFPHNPESRSPTPVVV